MRSRTGAAARLEVPPIRRLLQRWNNRGHSPIRARSGANCRENCRNTAGKWVDSASFAFLQRWMGRAFARVFLDLASDLINCFVFASNEANVTDYRLPSVATMRKISLAIAGQKKKRKSRWSKVRHWKKHPHGLTQHWTKIELIFLLKGRKMHWKMIQIVRINFIVSDNIHRIFADSTV